jgi:hypothetical protein
MSRYRIGYGRKYEPLCASIAGQGRRSPIRLIAFNHREYEFPRFASYLLRIIEARSAFPTSGTYNP